jgi:hypothetical protein
MKVYISNYRNHWLSPYTILEKIFFWKEIDDEGPAIERWAIRLEPLCNGLLSVLNVIHPSINYVKIDRWDTWSMDVTLAQIVVPMLKQLKKSKHGAPFVDDEDVPEELKSTAAPPVKDKWHTDDNYFKRWDWAMDEMLFAFEYKLTGEAIDALELAIDIKDDDKRIANGFRLFGKYYSGLWD